MQAQSQVSLPRFPEGQTHTVDDSAVNGGREPLDDGLRSPLGIRWLLVVGASLVAVSGVRLLASQWSQFIPEVKFLVLVAGALGIFGAGEVVRQRLRLPVAGAALSSLFTVLVPLLAWGAGRQRLLETPLGIVCTLAGLLALTKAGQHLFRRHFGDDGRTLIASLSVLLLAIPGLPFLQYLLVDHGRQLFLVASIVLGVFLRAASRHVNRILFHRDRAQGVDRPVTLLPFAGLAFVYLVAMASLSGFSIHLGIPLAFVAIALIDSGEEYYRALLQAVPDAPEAWPKRSKGLLVLGFATLVVALFTSLLDPSAASAALVTTLVAARLLTWSWHHRNAMAHAVGLGCGVIAYHLSPVLMPDFAMALYRKAMDLFGLTTAGGAVSLADLCLLALTTGFAAIGRFHWTRPMARVHAVYIVLLASVSLTAGLADLTFLAFAGPLTGALLAIGSWALRLPKLLLALHMVVPWTAYAWAEVLGIADWIPAWPALFALACAVGQHAMASRWADRDASLARLLDRGAVAYGLMGGLWSLNMDAGHSTAVWSSLIPTFLASAFFALRAYDDRQADMSTYCSAAFFTLASMTTVARVPLFGPEFYWVGPGIGLIMVAGLLRQRIGEKASGRLFTAGAVFLYAMPIMGLLGEVVWTWQVTLLLLAIAFGAASFHVRSRAMLLASSAALMTDLVFFLVELRQSQPAVLWILGIGLGLALMGCGAVLEHRRETIEQRLRIWGQQFQAWH